MQIVADENIPFAKQAFATLGSVRTVAGRGLSHADVRDADILLVRSVSKINAALLDNTPVKFVGTATIGFDHIDRNYLSERDIAFAHAPGSNATSAAEYVLSALLIMAERKGFDLRQQTVGIIGCGNVGSRVLKRLQALGVRCLINDPPRQAQQSDLPYVDLATVLQADIVSLHVPLEKTGQWPTLNLANAAFFQAMKPNALFMTTARGAVTDETALWDKLKHCPEFGTVLDVWQNEPNIDPALLARADLATPHIAGYSLDGKVRGTEMLYQAVCQHFNLPPQWSAADAMPPAPLQHLSFSASASADSVLQSAVLACYDVRRDDAALRRMTQHANRGNYFDQLRRNYPIRREFDQVSLAIADPTTRIQMAALGFRCE